MAFFAMAFFALAGFALAGFAMAFFAGVGLEVDRERVRVVIGRFVARLPARATA